MVTVARPYIILLISRLHLFSLSSLCTTNSVTSPLLIFFFLRCSQTHPHTNTSTQINQHKDTQTHPHTNKPTRTNQQRDKSMLDQNDQCLWNDQCLTGTIEARGSCLIGARKSDRAWSGLDRVWSKSWFVFEILIGAWSVWSVLDQFDLCLRVSLGIKHGLIDAWSTLIGAWLS